MKRKIVWACLAGMLSGSVFGSGSLYVKRADSVSSCDVSYYIGSNPILKEGYADDGTESLSDSVSFDKSIVVSNIVVNSGYLPAITVIDEYFDNDVVTNKISGSNGIYSYVPRYSAGTITFDLQTTLITNTITYVTYGGTLPPDSPMDYTVESPEITLPEPNRDHYDFAGWYTNDSFSGSVWTKIPHGSLGNRTFYADWTPTSYAIVAQPYPEAGGTVSGGGTYAYGATATLTATPSAGWVFTSWSDNVSVNPRSVQVTGAATYTANFVQNTYTITLDNQGADSSGDMFVTVAYGDVPPAISAPMRAGYDFQGYFSDLGGVGTKYYNADGTANSQPWSTTANGTIYAHWLPHAYTLSFDPGAGTGEMAPMALTYGVETNLPPVGFSREGYVFKVWKTNLTTDVVFADGQTVSNLTAEANGVVTMTATWSAGHYSIKFDANASDAEGEMAIQDIEYDEGTALAANAFTRVGYSLAGWAWDKDAATNEVDFADCQVVTNLTDEINSTNTLYAVWKADEYEVSLDANVAKGGYFLVGDVTNETILATVVYGGGYGSLPMPSNEFERMTFAGWKYVDLETGDVKPVPGTVPLRAAGITNLVAQWMDGLAAALNTNGTDLEYTTGGYKGGRNTAYDAPWIPRSPEGDERAGQSGDLPASDSGSYGSYLQTVLPGAGVLTYRWRLVAPVGYYFEDRDNFYGNCIQFVDADTNEELVPYLATGNDEFSTEWGDSDWQNVAFTNNSENPLTVEWRFRAQFGQEQLGGGTGWVDNVTWTSAGEPPVLAEIVHAVTSYDGTYDGEGHGIKVSVTTPESGWVVKYALDEAGPYAEEEILFTNVTETAETVWYTVAADGYATVTNSGTVKISPADEPPVLAEIVHAVTSYDDIYDGAGHGIKVSVTTPESGATVKYALDAAGPYAEGEILFTNVTETAVTVCYTVEAEGYATVTNSSSVKISPKTLTDTMVSVEETSCSYDGSAKEPAVTVMDGESVLTANDYDVAYSNNVAVGEATVVVVGKGNYVGEVQKHFTIARGEIVYTVSFYDGIYDGAGHGIEVNVTKPESGATIQYARNQEGPYSTEPILFTNVTETAEKVWYAIEAEGYASVTNSGRVKISPRVVPDDWETKIPWPTDKDGAYDPLVANVYDGWIVGADERLAGIVQVKAAKQTVKTVTDKATQIKTSVTNVAVTATVKDVAGKSWSYKGGVGTVEGVVTGLVCTTKGVAVASFGVKLGANGLSGKWDADNVLGARNGMGTKDDAMMAALEAYKGSWSAAFTNEAGVTHLQLVVGAKGSTKITGTTADGFKVSATVQGVMGEDAFFVPYLATLKSGKLTTEANLLLCIGADGAVAALTSSLGPLVAGGRTTDEIVFQPYAESACPTGGVAYAGAIVLNDLAYPAKFAAKGLPAGLKIDAATGVIAGTPTKPGHYVATVTVTSGINSKAKVETTVEFDIANYTDELIPVADAYGPYRVGVKVYEPIDAALGCAVSGLPAGLKYAAKEAKDATFGVVPAGTVYGVPTKAGESTVYFKKSTKETNDVGKVATVNHQASATFLVVALPAWAQGTFDGNVGSAASPSGQVTLTVDAKGKISGKLLEGDKTWTLSAPAYESEEARDNLDGLEQLENQDVDSTFIATVVGKSGKEVMTNEVAIAVGLLRHSADDGFDVRGVANAPADGAGLSGQIEWTAWQNLWKTDPWKIDAKAFANKKLTLYVVDDDEAGLVVRDALPEGRAAYGTIELKFAASGAVTASGKFVTGQDGKGYSASCSSVLIPESEVHYAVYLHFPPKAGKFDGYSVKVLLIWKDPIFQLGE